MTPGGGFAAAAAVVVVGVVLSLEHFAHRAVSLIWRHVDDIVADVVVDRKTVELLLPLHTFYYWRCRELLALPHVAATVTAAESEIATETWHHLCVQPRFRYPKSPIGTPNINNSV